MNQKARASSGHKLGQIVGDWFEEVVAIDLLERVANELGLFLDHRFRQRTCRGNKIIWSDLDGNSVDYDFVLEIGGTDQKLGIPVAFFETFWRRGSRHSKDKARDDSGKLMPMRATYPTARILGIVSAGDFTKPAQELVHSRGIDLFYIPKAHICAAWQQAGIEIDYLDSANEAEKSRIANFAEQKSTAKNKLKVFGNLKSIVGEAVFDSYVDRIIAGVSAVPIEYHITNIYIGEALVFSSFDEAKSFLSSDGGGVSNEGFERRIRYEAIYSDGSMFERSNLSPGEAIELHDAVGEVSRYFNKRFAEKRGKR